MRRTVRASAAFHRPTWPSLTPSGLLLSDLIDTILSIHSDDLSLPSLVQARSQLKTYLLRFKARLKGRNALHLKQLLLLLQGLISLGEAFAEQEKTLEKGQEAKAMWTVGEVVKGMGKGIDNINLLDLVTYMKESKIAVKVSPALPLRLFLACG